MAKHMVITPAAVRIGLLLFASSLQAQPSSKVAPARSTVEVIQFTGSVVRGVPFERPIGRNMVFRLEPVPEGWSIAVVIKKRPEDEHREGCEPLHGGSPCDLAGEYFTPNSKALDYLKSRTREFRVGLGRQLPLSDQEKRDNPDWWRTPAYERSGTGTLTIEDIKVDSVPGDEHPGILSMRFTVELRLPK
ncbi:MAG: hypothetical protein ACM3SQ_04645 [Betaproteobacteria bacterium]